MKIAALSACVHGAAAKLWMCCATRARVNEKGRTQITYNKLSVVIHWQTINIDTLSRFEMQTVVCKHGHCLIKFYIYKYVYLFILINCHSFRSFCQFYLCDTNSSKIKIVQWLKSILTVFSIRSKLVVSYGVGPSQIWCAWFLCRLMRSLLCESLFHSFHM